MHVPAVQTPKMTSKMKETIVSFLIISACSGTESQSSGSSAQDLSSKCIGLLEKMLDPTLWKHASLSVSRFDKLLQQAPMESTPNHPYNNYASALRILRVVLDKCDSQGLTQIGKMKTGLLKVSQCQNGDVSKAFQDFFAGLLQKYPMLVADRSRQVNADVDQLYAHFQKHFENVFATFDRTTSPTVLASLGSQFNLLGVMCEANRTNLDLYLPVIMKATQKLQKEHIVHSASAGQAMSAASTADHSTIVDLNVRALTLISTIIFRSDCQHRRPFVSSLQNLIEKTNSPLLLECVASIVGGIILDTRTTSLPPKEKASLFNKVVTVYSRRFPNHSTLGTVYEIILNIFQRNDLANSDVSAKLEGAFMQGLRARETKIRELFFQLHDTPNQDASLHGRLDYCFNDRYQRWDTSKTAFWVKHCLDTVLGGAVMSATTNAAPGVYRLPPLLSMRNYGSATGQRTSTVTSSTSMLKDHETFLTSLRRMSAEQILVPLRTLCYVSNELAYSMWVSVFPLVWQVLDNEARQSVGGCLQHLLAQDYHTEQTMVRPNNIHAILTGMLRASFVQPIPSPPPALLFHLAKTHNLWHTGIAMLRTKGRESDSRGEKMSDGKIDPIQDAVGDLYLHLGEIDTWFGLWRLRSKLSQSAKALAYEQQGYWEEAQHQYEYAMQTAVQHGMRDAEFRLWEHHWILCGERLGQHDLLVKYGDEAKNHDVILNSAWKLKSWKKLKDMVKRLSIQRDPNYRLNIAQMYLTIAGNEEQNVAAIEKSCGEAVQLALKAWASLPSIVSHSHVPILEAAQRLVELRESASLCHAMHPSNSMRTPPPDLSSLVELWRKRLPNMWDEIEVWQDLLMWRSFVFEKIGSMNKVTGKKETPIPFVQSETAWTINQLAKVARHHKMKGVCEKTLNTMYKMQSVDASYLFVKAKEQVLCHMQLSSDLEKQLEIINATNLQYFQPPQKSEFFALKGMVLHKLGKWKDANKSFSTSLSLCDDLGMAWEAWAVYCDDMFKRVRDSVKALKESKGNTSAAKRPKTEKNASTEQNAREWGKSAMTCYLNACRSYIDDEKVKKMIARALLMLSMDDHTSDIGLTFGRLVEGIDIAVWRFWIPQLITSLSRPEAKFVHGILVRLAKWYPQAIYCNLRTAFLEIRASDNHHKTMQRRKSMSDVPPPASGTRSGGAPDTVAEEVQQDQAAKKRLGDSPVDAVLPSTKRSKTDDATSGGMQTEENIGGPNVGASLSGGVPNTGVPAQTTPSTAQAPTLTQQVLAQVQITPSLVPAAAQTGAPTLSQAVAGGLPAPSQSSATNGTGSVGSASASAARVDAKTAGQTAASEASKSATDSSTPVALQHVSNIMQHLRIKHSMLAATMENMIEEIVVRFKPCAEDELLRTTRVLLTECLRHSFDALDRALEDDQSVIKTEDLPVPTVVAMHLNRILSSFLTRQNPSVLEYRQEFEADFGELGRITLDECLRHLNKWHTRIGEVVAGLPTCHRLEDLSPFLTNFTAAHAEIDLPGEHVERHVLSQAPHAFVRIERFLPDVQVIYSHSSASRRLTIRGRDGHTYPYVVKQAPTRHARTEERFLQLFRLLNTLLDRRKESRKRCLGYHVPRMVPLNTHVQLYQDDATSLSLEDVFQEYCSSGQMTVDKPVMDCYEMRRRDLRTRTREGKPLRDIRKDIFDNIRRQNVPSDILSRFMRATFPDHAELWMFQRQFSIEIAMMAFATQMFMMNKGAPHTLKFVLNTGHIMSWDMVSYRAGVCTASLC